jgi:predicted DNA binding CopG/RHH family protein
LSAPESWQGNRGVGYQTLIKTLLHEALKRESKIA